ncbi:hypothetical protein ACFYZB_04675 [Streptomyces sp. NPDC001852]|uniref:hypothetical protein n=1 Tax=Streptomyces sp. NPDC001852 TaxID=3364619 RepID=UPI0036D0A4C9
MRTLQRAALVAAVVAGLSALGAGASFADGDDGPYQVSAVASAQATAVVTWEAPHRHEESKPGHEHHGHKPCRKHHESKPCHKHHPSKPCHKHRFSRAWVDVSTWVG